MDFDSILPSLGEFGKFQKIIFVALCIPASLPCCFTFFNSLFIVASPNHWCHVPELSDLDLEARLNFSIPMETRDGLYVASQCMMYDVNYTELRTQNSWTDEDQKLWNVTKCRYGWEYDHTNFKRTLVTEMDVVCDRKWMASFGETMLFTGALFGNFFFGWLSDKHGRRKAFLVLILSNVILGLIASFPPNFTFYLVLRGLIGMTFIPLYQIPFVLALELMSPSKRCASAMAMSAIFSIGMMILALVAWLVKDWFILSLLSSVPFIVLVSYWWIIPESPRWLLSQNKVEEAEEIVQKIARINKKEIPPNFLKSTLLSKELDSGDDSSVNFWDIFRYPNLRKRLLIVNFFWICNDIVYIGLSYSATSLGGNEYIAFAISGLVEIPGIFIAWYFMDTVGRRITLFFCMIATGVFCLATALVEPDNITVMMVLSSLGKLAITGSFSVAYMFSGELFPTSLRSVALSTGSITGSAALMVAPQMLRQAANHHRILPIIIMGVLALMGGITGSFLPETFGAPLPQTIEEGENFGKDMKYWSYPKKNKVIPMNMDLKSSMKNF